MFAIVAIVAIVCEFVIFAIFAMLLFCYACYVAICYSAMFLVCYSLSLSLARCPRQEICPENLSVTACTKHSKGMPPTRPVRAVVCVRGIKCVRPLKLVTKPVCICA